MNKIKVLFFATLRQRAGTKEIELEVPDALDVRGLMQRLAREIPDLESSLGTVLVSINREYAFEDAPIPLNAEVALFPPVSGG
jgi:molybdopterin converting factor subunit 1